jgi:hypothetical protein
VVQEDFFLAPRIRSIPQTTEIIKIRLKNSTSTNINPDPCFSRSSSELTAEIPAKRASSKNSDPTTHNMPENNLAQSVVH